MRKVIFWICAAALLVLLVLVVPTTFRTSEVSAPPAGGSSEPPAEEAPPPPPPAVALPPPSPPPPAPDFAAIDRALEALPVGSVAFNVPAVMTLNRSEDVHLLLSPSMSAEELQRQLAERLDRETDIKGVEIRIAPRMEARLSGTSFEILALTPEVQSVTWNEPTEWRWEARPAEVGNQTLHLTLTALLEINGAQSMRSIRTLDRQIQVHVTWPQRIAGFAEENWQWLWTTVAVPIALWLWGKRRKKPRTGT